ncbi:MAG: tRNA threonylcarbamoyladenosine dehydratase [Spirochaetaceae bacterium]|jgi:tRNA A37 threonylcarbamoyladenosine dehydratase|nr:tRNA threonylcarbamoyladenosine dehydratase [Spirochaetaceae bacterium]
MPINPVFQRLGLLTGVRGLDALAEARVIVFGLGGVGGWCAEALVRSGIGNISIVDSDTVCVTNINRQVQATMGTIGLSKAEALRTRLLDINPRCHVTAFDRVFSRETASIFGISRGVYVIDAIDSLTHKLDLIELCTEGGAILFSSMGMAQKLDPTRLKTADIWETAGCPLARLVRQGLRKRGYRGRFTVVYSTERLPRHGEIAPACGSGLCLCPSRRQGTEGPPAGCPAAETVKQGAESTAFPVEWCSSKKVINGSAVTVTAGAGMILASLAIRNICFPGEGRSP